MSTDRETTAAVRAWLRTSEHESAERVLGNVLDRLDATPQRRRTWGAWRTGLMSSTLKFAAAGTAVVIVAAIALGVYLSRPGVPPAASPTPSASAPGATSSASPSASPTSPSAAGFQDPWLIYQVSVSVDQPAEIWAEHADGSGRHPIWQRGGNVSWTWSSDGQQLVLYEDQGRTIWAAPVDSESIGELVELGVAPGSQNLFKPVLAPTGDRIAFSSVTSDGGTIAHSIVIVDVATSRATEIATTTSGLPWQLGWSPDGTQLVYALTRQIPSTRPSSLASDLFVVTAGGTNQRQLDLTSLAGAFPSWSPDGSAIVFESTAWPDEPTLGASAPPVFNVWTIRPDGTDLRQVTVTGDAISPSWTTDGNIVFGRPDQLSRYIDVLGPGTAWMTAAAGGNEQELGHVAHLGAWQPVSACDWQRVARTSAPCP